MFIHDTVDVKVSDIVVEHSRNAGITIRDASRVALWNVRTHHTFSSGIAVWDSNHDGVGTANISITDCEVTGANDLSLAHPGYTDTEAPHEAISVGGTVSFVVNRCRVHHNHKEGIDIKETSAKGAVTHNDVHHNARQGIYVGAYFGLLHGINVVHNEVWKNHGAGIVLAVEDTKASQESITVKANDVHDNDGTGIWIARFGDGPQKKLAIVSNRVTRNGGGAPDPGRERFWITGGIWLHARHASFVEIAHNDVMMNRDFQIGMSVDDADVDVDVPFDVAHVWNNIVGGDDPNRTVRYGWGPSDLTLVKALP